MNTIPIGIDISKTKFDIAYEETNQKWHHRTFNNTPEGFKDFHQGLLEKGIETCHAVMEATGRYGEDLATFLYVSGHKVSIVNPSQIKYYSQSLLKRTKTDKMDSKIIAQFALHHEVPSWSPLSPELQALKDQVRCLEAFKKDATQTSNRLGCSKDPLVRKMLEERLTHIQKQIDTLTRMIRKLVQNDPSLASTVSLLTSIPGIAETTAFRLLGELPNLSTFKGAKQLAAFAGLNPSIKTSGTSVKGRGAISKTGSKELRKILFFPAMAVMRLSSPIKPFVETLRQKGKKGKVIVVAVMRKLLHIVFGILKTKVPFQSAS